MLAVAKETAPAADLRHEDITTGGSSVTQESFDLITAFRFFPNAEPQLRDEAMAALAPLLTSEGVMVFNNHLNHTSLMRSLGRRLGRFRATTMTHDEAVELAHRHGLRVATTWSLGALPLNDKLLFLPRAVREAEWALARLACYPRLAQDVLYVCLRR